MQQTEFNRFKEKLDASETTLVAVSKTKSVEEIRRLYDWGQRDFGENYVQELGAKKDELPQDINWHFIGHLQRNKVKDIAGFIHLIHAIDSERLLKEVNKQAIRHNRNLQVLLQVHIADESTKFGLEKNEVRELLPHLDLYANVDVRGLMGMASFTDDMNRVAKEFEGLKQLFDECRQHENARNWDTLSMGMSADYEIALQHGSSMIRIGTMIFGERPQA